MNIDKSVLKVPLYPFLIALAPVVNLFVLNRLQLESLDIVRPAIVYLIVAAVAVSLSRLFCRSGRGAALLGCLIVLSLVGYGFAFYLVHNALNITTPPDVFLSAWLLLTGVLYVFLTLVIRRTQSSLLNITIVLNTFGAVVLALAVMPLILAGPASPNASRPETPDEPPVHEWLQSKNMDPLNTDLPDIYYIVLDAYSRGDVLRSRFDYDNSDFLNWLEMKGFFVAHQSHSNYAWTHLSLASTLNGEYLDTLVPQQVQSMAPEDFSLRFSFIKSILADEFVKNSRVHRFFSSLGYRIISNDTGYAVTRKASTTLTAALSRPLSQFEEALAGQTFVKPLIPIFRSWALLQELQISKFDRIVGTLADLEEAADDAGPKFVFYHVVSPHGPFCFDDEGEMIPPYPLYDASPWLQDKFAVPGYVDWFTENYPPNLAGLNHRLKETFQSILDSSAGNAIVIIQADHGTHTGFDLQSAANTDVVERFGILNAVYLPAAIPRDGLEQTMSSVNTFRVVFNNAFGLDLPLLENRAYYSIGDLDFVEVTDRLHDPAD